NVGVIGLGMMGLTHLDAYAKRSDVKVVAISDKNPDRLSGKARAVGNVEGQAQGGFDLSSAKGYTEGLDLINDPAVQLVDVCVATPWHVELALAALAAGKHVLVEKPLARTSADARRLADAAAKSKGLAMCAMCMRFWPGWTWLKDAIDRQTYGRVLSAQFRRMASMPPGAFYANADLSGAAVLDLHLHDTDFVQFCFGLPAAVYSRGYSKTTTGIDHVRTEYLYPPFPAPSGPPLAAPIVSAEGSWAMTDGYEFRMEYTVNFERATAVYDLRATDKLVLYASGQRTAVPLEDRMGYDIEIEYFLRCIARNERPKTITLEDAAHAIRITEAEEQSARTGEIVGL
ncbi:MAG TPA: Gfo/Idh/MocA family oxidoreductase, partial [Tepidisphaeraceae bacterium]|nr:Gfo/Idh/MocA family oxidoreductase [Tepidisphaeraceae bacterium]